MRRLSRWLRQNLLGTDGGDRVCLVREYLREAFWLFLASMLLVDTFFQGWYGWPVKTSDGGSWGGLPRHGPCKRALCLVSSRC